MWGTSVRADQIPVGAIDPDRATRLRVVLTAAALRLRTSQAFPDDARIVAVELEELLK